MTTRTKKTKQKRKLELQQMDKLILLEDGKLSFEKNEELELKLELQNRARESYIVREVNSKLVLGYDHNPLSYDTGSNSKNLSMPRAVHDLDFKVRPEFLAEIQSVKNLIDNSQLKYKDFKKREYVRPGWEQFDHKLSALEETQEDEVAQAEHSVTEDSFLSELQKIPYASNCKPDVTAQVYNIEGRRGPMNLHPSLYPKKKSYDYKIIPISVEESVSKFSGAVLPDRFVSTINRHLVQKLDSDYRPPKGFLQNLMSEEYKTITFDACMNFISCKFTLENILSIFTRKDLVEASKEAESSEVAARVSSSNVVYNTVEIETDPIDLMSFKEENVTRKREKNYSQAEKELELRVESIRQRVDELSYQKRGLISSKQISDERIHVNQDQLEREQLEEIMTLLQDGAVEEDEESRIKEHIRNSSKLRKGRDASAVIKLELLLNFVSSYKQNKQTETRFFEEEKRVEISRKK